MVPSLFSLVSQSSGMVHVLHPHYPWSFLKDKKERKRSTHIIDLVITSMNKNSRVLEKAIQVQVCLL